MTKEEAICIKSDILAKEGSVSIGNSFIINNVVWLSDMIKIINKYEEKSEDKG